MKVHPAFDTETMTWYLENPAVEAKSLRELKQLLGKGYQILDYYPNGSPATIWPTLVLPEPIERVAQAAPAQQQPAKRRAAATKGNWGTKKKYDYEAIARMWLDGYTGPEIGEALGLPKSTTAAQIIARLRDAGDTRFPYRAKWRAGRNRISVAS